MHILILRPSSKCLFRRCSYQIPPTLSLKTFFWNFAKNPEFRQIKLKNFWPSFFCILEVASNIQKCFVLDIWHELSLTNCLLSRFSRLMYIEAIPRVFKCTNEDSNDGSSKKKLRNWSTDDGVFTIDQHLCANRQQNHIFKLCCVSYSNYWLFFRNLKVTLTLFSKTMITRISTSGFNFCYLHLRSERQF